MKNIKSYILIAAMGLVFASCEKTIEFNGDESDPYLVVNAVLYADSLPTVMVSQSTFFLNPNMSDYDGHDATVRLYVNGEFYESLSYSDSTSIGSIRGFFRGTKTLHEGDSVRIEAEAPNFETVHAEAIIPHRPVITGTNAEMKAKTYLEEYGSANFVEDENGNLVYVNNPSILATDVYSYTISFGVTFNDPAESNYYAFNHGFYSSIYSDDPVMKENISSMFSSISNDDSPLPQPTIFSDKLINGSAHTLSFRIEGINPNNSEYFYDGAYHFDFDLMQIEKSMYLYKTTVDQSGFNLGINLFIEPVQVYTNVSGGLGLVSGVADRPIQIVIPE